MTVSENISFSVGEKREIRQSSAEMESAEARYAEVSAAIGYMTITLPAGVVVTGAVAARAAAEFQELAPPGLAPLLLDVTGVESITRSARIVFGASRVASAVAVLGATPVDRVIANFLLGGELPPCPAKYFTSKADALSWLGAHTNV